MADLYMDMCRSMGLAARFVSGYVLQEKSDFSREMHAWVEVYVPGGGWRGFDPSVGLAVSGDHLRVAVGHNPSLAAPVEGTFRGTGAQAELEHRVEIVPHAGQAVASSSLDD